MIELNLQLLGGRGSGSGGSDNMSVPYDDWGEMIAHENIFDEDGNYIGYYEDTYLYNQVEYAERVTKEEILKDVDGWRNDDGTYGDDDIKILIAYKNGDVVDVNGLNGKHYKTSGIIGVSVSTPDYTSVWGREYNSRNGSFSKLETSSYSEGKTYTNTTLGYKQTEQWRVRYKVIRERLPNGNYINRRTVVRKSTHTRIGN